MEAITINGHEHLKTSAAHTELVCLCPYCVERVVLNACRDSYKKGLYKTCCPACGEWFAITV